MRAEEAKVGSILEEDSTRGFTAACAHDFDDGPHLWKVTDAYRDSIAIGTKCLVCGHQVTWNVNCLRVPRLVTAAALKFRKRGATKFSRRRQV